MTYAPAEFAITEGRAPLTDGRSGLRVLRLLHAASRSLELGGATVPLSAGSAGSADSAAVRITAQITSQERATAR